MIDKETKKKFLEELEKDGIPYSACRRSGLSKATLYRILKTDPDFKKRFKESKRIGLENTNDMTQFALNQLIREKNLGAIKWAQKHCDPRFKSRTKKVIIEHSNIGKIDMQKATMEEWAKHREDTHRLADNLQKVLELGENDDSEDTDESSE